MAEETAVAEPQTDAMPEGFGNLADAFDKAFPATKGEPRQPEQPDVPASEFAPPPEPAPEKPAEVAPPAEPVKTNLPPDRAFEDDPAPVEKKEYDAPESIKKDAKSYANWNELRRSEEKALSEAVRLSAENESLRKKAETASTDQDLQSRLAQAEKANQELSSKIATVDLQSHPEYQRRFVQGREAMVESAVSIIKDAGGMDPDDLRRAMSMEGKSRIEALDEIVESISSPTLRGQLATVITQVNDLDRQRTSVLANAAGNLAAIRQQDATNRHRTIQEEEKRVNGQIEGVYDYLGKEKKIAFFREVEGDENWNKVVREDRETVRELALRTTDQPKLIGTLALGVAAVRMYDSLLSMRQQLQAAQKEIADFKGADPSLNGNRQEESSVSPAEKGLSFAESVAVNSGLR